LARYFFPQQQLRPTAQRVSMALRIMVVAVLLIQVSATDCSGAPPEQACSPSGQADSAPTTEIESLPCPSSKLEVRRVASISPRCLEHCPQLCTPIGDFMATSEKSRDLKAVKARGCDYKAELDCAFETAAFDECQKIISMFTGLTSQAAWGEFKQACSSSGQADSAPTTEIESLPCPSSTLEVRRVASISPQCLEHCPRLCTPIRDFMATYEKSRDLKAVKARGCDYKAELDCAFETAAIGECQKIVSRFTGLTSQAAWGEFKQACSTRKEIRSLPCPSAPLQVRRVASISPQCLEQCPQLCTPIGDFMATYEKSRDLKAVKARGCDYRAELACAFETAAVGECQKVLSRFTGFTSQAAWDEFKQACSSASRPVPAFLPPSYKR